MREERAKDKSLGVNSATFLLACVASGSARVRRENWNESKKRNEGGGGGECSRSKLRAITRLETLATQATFLSTFCLLRMPGLGKLLSGTWN